MIRSTIRGATLEIFSLLALIFAYLFSCRYYSFCAKLLQKFIDDTWLQNILAYVILFLLVYLAIKFLGWLVSRLLQHIRLSLLDKIGGTLIGAAKGSLVACFLILLLLVLLPNDNRTLKNSTFFSFSLPLIERIAKIIPDPFKNIINQKTQTLKKSVSQKNLTLEKAKNKIGQQIKELNLPQLHNSSQNP